MPRQASKTKKISVTPKPVQAPALNVEPDKDLTRLEWDSAEPEVAPWTAEQVRQWRSGKQKLDVKRLFVWQSAAGLLACVVCGVLAGQSAAWSAAYGSVCVLLPGALFARGVLRPAPVGVAVVNFFVWEAVKLALTLALLALAPKLVAGLVWPALLAGLVVTMKASWLAMMLRPGHNAKNDI
jgi:ATP synthase protein I